MFSRIKFAARAATLALCLAAAITPARPQDVPKKPLSVSAQTITAKGEELAVGLLIKYLDELNAAEIEGVSCSPAPCTFPTYYFLKPDIKVEAAEEGLFQSIVAKLSGEVMITSASLDNEGFVDLGIRHVFPLSAGVETTRFGDSYAALAEIGYVPYYPHFMNQPFVEDTQLDLGIDLRFGVFLQAGYKFAGGDEERSGGSEDESSEPVRDELLRAKGDFRFNLLLPNINPLSDTGTSMLMTWATGWYDIAHDAFYHSIGATLRLDIPTSEATYMDFTVEDGSGAPNFNTGTQFSAGLTMAF
jgi:hypothetical protein